MVDMPEYRPRSGGEEGGAGERSRIADRLHAARIPLSVTLLVLIAGTLFWSVPPRFALLAAGTVCLVTAFLPRRRLGRRVEASLPGDSPWPDASIRATIGAMPMAAILIDGDLVVRFANDRAARLFPTTRPGGSFRLTFRSPEVNAALEDMRRFGYATIEHREVGERSGVYSIVFSRLRRPGDSAGYVLVTFDDVSERLAVARMRADFVANASHELRTPLASLTGFIETLLGPAKNDPEATARFLRIMLDQARRMGRLIDDLLSLSRVEMRVHRPPTESVDLVSIVRGVADALAVLAAEHGVTLDLHLPDGAVHVAGDHDELVQVFQNLVENAIRYGAAGGRVAIAISRPKAHEGAVSVSVRDYGPGIPAEHLPRLTERFYRVDVESSRAMKGTGLGLAIVKHILTRHRARLEVESEVGKGATFRVEFPENLRVPENSLEDAVA